MSLLKIKFYHLAIIILLQILQIEAANILVINHFPMRSHMRFIGEIIDSLVQRHNVTLYTAIPHTDANRNNLTQIVLQNDEFDSRLLKVNEELYKLLFNKQTTYFERDQATTNLFYEQSCLYAKSQPILDLYNSSMKYDVMLLNALFSECFLTLGYLKNIPVIQVSPTFAFYWHYTMVGDRNNFGTSISHQHDNLPTGKFFDIISDTIVGYYLLACRYWYVQTSISTFTNKYLPHENIPSLSVLEKSTSMLFTNTVPAMGHARSKNPMIVDVGGLHCQEAKKLPKDLDEFISGAGQHGFIFISFGGTMPTKLFPNKVRDTFMDAFRQIPQRVVWKWHEEVKGCPDNVLISQWAPQQDILGDSRIKAFISQCGMLSMQEASYHGVPVIGVPIGTDQLVNAALVVDRGYGCRLNVVTLTVDKILHCINQTVHNSSFKRSAYEVSAVMRDTLVSPLDTAVWWTEFVIRHQGVRLLTPRAHGMPWYRQMDMEVIIVVTIAFILLLVFITVTLLCRRLKKMIWRPRHIPKKVKTK